MLPVSSTQDSTNCLLRHTEFLGEHASRDLVPQIPSTDLENLYFCQDRSSTVFPPSLSRLAHFVLNVVAIRPEEQVFRVDAARIIASVKNMHPRRDRSVDYLPRHTMRSTGLPLDGDRPVPLWRSMSSPFPARRIRVLIDLSKEPCSQWRISLPSANDHPSRPRQLRAVKAAKSPTTRTLCVRTLDRKVRSANLTEAINAAIHASDRAEISRPDTTRLSVESDSAFIAVHIRGMLGVHFWDLLSRFRGAMPRGVCSTAGALCVPPFYQIFAPFRTYFAATVI